MLYLTGLSGLKKKDVEDSDKQDLSTSIFRKLKHSRGISACDLCSADLQSREKNIGQAYHIYLRQLFSSQMRDTQLPHLCLVKLADPTHPLRSDAVVARWALIFLAFAMCPLACSILTVHQALQCLGDVLVRQGMDNDALSILTVALDGSTWMDVHQSRAECMRTLGDLHFHTGNFTKHPPFGQRPDHCLSSSYKRRQLRKSIIGL
jgi:hypothetical protein